MKTPWLQKAVEEALCEYTRSTISGYEDKATKTAIHFIDNDGVVVYWWHSYPAEEQKTNGYVTYTAQEALRIFLAS